MSIAIRNYHAEMRQLQELRPKCDRNGCQEPSTLRSVLCKTHLAEHERFHRIRTGALPQPHIYVCPTCLDETDDPSHLCKCPY